MLFRSDARSRDDIARIGVRFALKRIALLLALGAACGGAEGASPSVALARLTRLQAGDTLLALARPAAFAGAMPCADCAGIDATFVLHPDGSYRAQEHRRGAPRGEPRTLVEVGRWNISADSVPQLTLHRAAGAQRFLVRSQLRIELVERPGITSDGPYELVRVSAPPSLVGTLRVRGEFRYFADAATLVTCNGGRLFPVSGDSAFVRLEALHRDHPLGDGAATRADLVGRLELRAGMESGTLVETIVVDSFAPVETRDGCDATRVRGSLAVGDWVVTALDGVPLAELDHALRPTMRIVISESQLFGNAGCNRFTGRAALRGLDLIGQPMALTKRMCADSTLMAREARYAQILSAGGWFRLDSTDLVLSQSGSEVARFRRR